MKSRLIVLVFGAGLLWALMPHLAQAQGTSSSTSSSSNLLGGSSSSSGGTSSQTVSAAIGAGLTTTAQTVAASSGTPSATTIPSSANVLGSSYVNYFTLGLPANYAGKFGAQNTSGMTGTFGKYIYIANATTSTGGASTASTTALGFTTFGQPRAPYYTTSFAESFPVVRLQIPQIQADAKDAIARSTMLKNKDSIQVAMNGGIVLLTGSVGSETERITAEGMVRMTPGVGDVQNNLVIDPSKK